MRRFLKLLLPLMGLGGLARYVFLGLLSGASSFLFINLVTRTITRILAGDLILIRTTYALLFAGVIMLFVATRKILASAVIRMSQTLFWDLRQQLILQVLRANYWQLTARRAGIHAAIVSDVNVLTNASMNVIEFVTSLILALASLAYLASISSVLFLVTLLTAAMGAAMYQVSARRNDGHFAAARELENSFLRQLNAILDGFKEIYMEPKKGQAIYQDKVTVVAREAYLNNTQAFRGLLANQITGQVLFYTLVAAVLLYLGPLLDITATDTVSYVFTLLYLLNAVETIMLLLPNLMRARIAANHLMDLKQELNGSPDVVSTRNGAPLTGRFDRISVEDMKFQYPTVTVPGFVMGPVNLEISRGEVVFIYGGNGSGKTTLLYALLGLCPPVVGTLRVNGETVGETQYPSYRAMFAVVFSNFYLFDELYGVEQADLIRWQYYLNLFELEGKVKLENNCFTTTDLSMGQRKRLALIAVLLENKPVLVLDEWAADQDPYFRRKFYTQIIPLLKQEGTTLIAITHDDRYYHCADRLWRMEYGQLTEACPDAFASQLG